ncbi:MAG: hypothetical protein Q9190_003094 [Brigantiaea leucoxantha]
MPQSLLVLADCECGYVIKSPGSDEPQVYTDAFETNFLQQNDIASDADWIVQKYPRDSTPFRQLNQAQNVVSNPISGDSAGRAKSGDPGLQLFVKPPVNGAVPISELVTSRTDMLYGSYRAALKYTAVPGTCGGFFFYYDDNNEIDVELLSSRRTSDSTNPVFLVIHSPSPPPSQSPQVPFHPDDGFHEYRFDWTPDSVSFFADGALIGTMNSGLPTHPGRIIFNHWSNGDNGWTRGPPTENAVMSIAYVKAYFNSSSDAGATQRQLTDCKDPAAPNAVCEVPDMSGVLDIEQPTRFFTKGDSSSAGSAATSNPPQPTKPTSSPTPQAPQQQSAQTQSATATEEGGKKTTVDASCGGEKGYTCLGGQWGDCCSSHGWWYVSSSSFVALF